MTDIPKKRPNGFARRGTTLTDRPYQVDETERRALRSLERDWNRKKEIAP